MNCESLQKNLFEYLDDSLSPREKIAVETHLTECLHCREAVQRERQFAQSLSSRFEQTVGTVTLEASAQHRMAAMVERRLAEFRPRSLLWFWRRLALPFAGAMLLMVALWGKKHFASRTAPQPELASLRAPASNQESPIHAFYLVPSYTFRREGGRVIDALTFETRVHDGALLVKN